MRQVKRWLAFAASPCFALMTAMSAPHGSDPAALICSSMPGGSPGGMTLMYALMSLFHASPWFGLIRSPARGRESKEEIDVSPA